MDGPCVLVCRACSGEDDTMPLVLPFDSYAERGRWAGAHTRGTGHDRWLALDGWPTPDEVAVRLAVNADVEASVRGLVSPLRGEVARLLLRVADLDGARAAASTAANHLRGGIARALGLDEVDVPADDELIKLLTIRLHGHPGEDA